MSHIQLNYLLTTLIRLWDQYGKNILPLIVLTVLIVSLLDPNMTVLANGATSTAGATGG